jgi:NAD(P)H-hydrate epimerase
MINVTKDILKIIYKERPPEVKKYNYGLLLVIGGSEFYSGSPALSALAGLRAGADMAYVIAPKRAADIIASFGPDLATYPLEGKCLMEKHLSTLISMTESAKIVSHGKTAVVIGGGAGRSEETKKVIKDYLSQISIPAVIDADAIHAIADCPELISKKPFLITPHSFEFFILTGKEIKGLPIEEKIKVVQEQARILGVTILLKGKTDIISDGKEIALSNTGSPYMSIGGTGDSLAGIAGSIMAQGFDPFLAAQAAAFINGKAGELAAKAKKESMLTTDLIEALSKVLH